MRISCYFLVLILAATSVLAGDGPLGAHTGVLLLRNGSVIEGEILREGDRYEVRLEDGALRVRADEVEFVGRTLDDCYHHQLAGIDITRVQDHLTLAEWCVRNNLYSAAGRELREAMICDPHHPMIGVLERRLKLAIAAPPSSGPAEPRKLSAPTTDELDRLVEGMPPGTVETFTTVIQPMLVNQCSTAGCHGPGSTNSLSLMRISANHTSRRATQRNLYAVLQLINTERPDDSPLLTMPTRAHGTSRAAVFTNRQTQQYRQLVDWVYSVSSKQRDRKSGTKPALSDWPVAEKGRAKPIAEATAGKNPESPTIAAKYLKHREEVERVQAVVGADSFEHGPKLVPHHATPQEAPADEDAPALLPAGVQLGRRIVPGQSSMRSLPTRGDVGEAPKPQDPFDPTEFNQHLPGEATTPDD